MTQHLNEIRLQNRYWGNRVVSPLDFGSADDVRRQAVLIHPGWGKKPELFHRFMTALAEHDFMPIGLDTRFGYANIPVNNGESSVLYTVF